MMETGAGPWPFNLMGEIVAGIGHAAAAARARHISVCVASIPMAVTMRPSAAGLAVFQSLRGLQLSRMFKCCLAAGSLSRRRMAMATTSSDSLLDSTGDAGTRSLVIDCRAIVDLVEFARLRGFRKRSSGWPEQLRNSWPSPGLLHRMAPWTRHSAIPVPA